MLGHGIHCDPFLQSLSESKHLADCFHLFGCMDEDGVDACMSAWTLGGGSDAFALQMQCMIFVMSCLQCVPLLP